VTANTGLADGAVSIDCLESFYGWLRLVLLRLCRRGPTGVSEGHAGVPQHRLLSIEHELSNSNFQICRYRGPDRTRSTRQSCAKFVL